MVLTEVCSSVLQSLFFLQSGADPGFFGLEVCTIFGALKKKEYKINYKSEYLEKDKKSQQITSVKKSCQKPHTSQIPEK